MCLVRGVWVSRYGHPASWDNRVFVYPTTPHTHTPLIGFGCCHASISGVGMISAWLYSIQKFGHSRVKRETLFNSTFQAVWTFAAAFPLDSNIKQGHRRTTSITSKRKENGGPIMCGPSQGGNMTRAHLGAEGFWLRGVHVAWIMLIHPMANFPMANHKCSGILSLESPSKVCPGAARRTI